MVLRQLNASLGRANESKPQLRQGNGQGALVMKRNSFFGLFVLIAVAAVFLIFRYQVPTPDVHRVEFEDDANLEAFEYRDASPEETRLFPLAVLAANPRDLTEAPVHQLSVTFNKPIAMIGQEEHQSDLFEVSPKVDCQWKWISRSQVSCEFPDRLPFSTSYKVKVKSGLKAFDETVLEKDYEFQFTTKKWNVDSVYSEWKSPSNIEIFLTFNQKMDLDSLKKETQSNCGAFRWELVNELEDPRFYFLPEQTYKLTNTKGIEPSSECNLNISPLAKSKEGDLDGKSFVFDFKAYPDFAIASVSCAANIVDLKQDESAFTLSGCNPDSAVTITFDSPIYGTELSKIAETFKIEPFFGWKKTGTGSPEYYKVAKDKLFTNIVLQGPMQPSASHKITIGNLKDRFGRGLVGPKSIFIQTNDMNSRLSVDKSFAVFEKEVDPKIDFSSTNLVSFEVSLFNSGGDLSLVELDRMLGNPYGESESACDPNEVRPGKVEKLHSFSSEKNQPFYGSIPLRNFFSKPDQNSFLGFVQRPTQRSDLKGAGYVQNCQPYFAMSTDLGLMVKVGYFDTSVWVHSISTGKPVSGAKVSLNTKSKSLSSGTTNSDGYVLLEGAKGFDPNRDKYTSEYMVAENIFIKAEKGSDQSVLPFKKGIEGLSPSEFATDSKTYDMYYTPLTKSSRDITVIVTDRPLYKPGQKVGIKLISRDWDPMTFGLKPKSKIEIEVRDPMNQKVGAQSLTLNEYGTASFQMDLGAGARLGRYTVIMPDSNEWGRYLGGFEVYQFSPPPFSLEVQPIKSKFTSGERVVFRTSAKFNFGGAMANAKGAMTAVYSQGYWYPKSEDYKMYQFSEATGYNVRGLERPQTNNRVTIGEGLIVTDSNGENLTALNIPKDTDISFANIYFESRFPDDRGKDLARNSTVSVFNRDFLLGVDVDYMNQESQKEVKFKTIALTPNEKPVYGLDVKARLVHRDYHSVRVKNIGGHYDYSSRYVDTLIDKCDFKLTKENSSCQLKPTVPGSYHIVVETNDSKGRRVRTAGTFYSSSDEGYVSWNRENHDRIELVTDKPKYQIGDVASLLVKSPYEEAEAIVTLERFGVLEHFRKTIKGSDSTIEIPLKKREYAPGFYVSVHLIKGRVESQQKTGGPDLGKPSFKMGLKKIQVEDPDTVLNVSLKTDKTEYRPQEKVKLEIDVNSLKGKRKSEIMIAVVDDKYLQTSSTGLNDYDLHKHFYHLRGPDVLTSQLLTFLVGRRHFGKKGDTEGGDGAASDMMKSKSEVRKEFLPIAYWNPDFETDGSGKGSVEFKLPDNLTTWRVVAVALDKENRFGFSNVAIIANKKLMIEPALPNFLVDGDEADLRFVITNKTGKKASIETDFSIEGAATADPTKKISDVDSGGRSPVSWNVKTTGKSEYANLSVKSQDKNSGFEDSVLVGLPILKGIFFDVSAEYGSTERDSVTQSIMVSDQVDIPNSKAELIFSPSLIPHLSQSYQYLMEYPYNCWEQVLSRALSVDFFRDLNDYLETPTSQDFYKYAMTTVGHFSSVYQNSSGGFGYWKSLNSTVDPYLSAFTGYAFEVSANVKNSVSADKRELLNGYLLGLLEGKAGLPEHYQFPKYYSEKDKLLVQAMALYGLKSSGKKLDSNVNALFQKREGMDLFSKSLLWVVASQSPTTKSVADALGSEVLGHQNVTSGRAQIVEKKRESSWVTLESEEKTHCRVLTSLFETKSNIQLIEPMTRSVLESRKYDRWSNTHDNIFCLQAMIYYAKSFESKKPDYTVQAKVGSQSLEPASFKGYQQKPVTMSVPLADLKEKRSLSVDIKKQGEGRLYYTTRLHMAKNIKLAVNSESKGFSVTRRYFLKDPTTQKFVEASLPASSAKSTANNVKAPNIVLKRGGLVRIELKVVVPASRYHVALEDSLPGGLEPLNLELATTSQTVSEATEGESEAVGSFEDWLSGAAFYHTEKRDTGALYFAHTLAPGEYKVSYTAQAIATGVFTARPAKVEEMYSPDIYGRTAAQVFEIKD